MSVPVAILMGSEDEGVSPEILRVCDELVKVPQFGSIQSLNVSVAAGVMIYEVVRQRAIDY
jgi:23S rRNA (guanosine2251-2'-O)-methyltransferase